VFVQPRILVAPGFSHTPGATSADKGPVAAALEVLAERLRGVAVIDIPGTAHESHTREAAVAFRANFGGDRTYFHWPHYKVAPKYVTTEAVIIVPASASIAGRIAKTDNDEGFWNSPSNRQMLGILGLARPVDFLLNDPNTTANYLNENNVSTTIHEQGFRLWGNRVASGKFLNQRRTADMIQESILYAHLWAVDRNITRGFVEEVVGGVNEYIRRLVATGALIGGRAWADPELNTRAVLSSGQLIIDFDFSTHTPAERITFRAHMVNDYITEIFDTAADGIATVV
jgi:hypothetical protein